MRRFWRVYREFVRSSLQRELEFRANFIAKLFQNLTWLAFFLVILSVTYSHTTSLAGWDRYEALLLTGTCFFVDCVVRTFCMSLLELPEQVRQGTLDFVVTKPMDAQLWISTRKVQFDQIGQLLLAFGLVIYGASHLGHSVGLFNIAEYVLLVVCAILIYYSVLLGLMTLAIWFVRVENLWVLGETTFQVTRYPMDIFPVGVRQALTFAVPIAFLATIPANALRQPHGSGMLGFALLYTGLALGITRVFWVYSIRHYSSASS